MKTVSGQVVSTKSVSLSQAARTISAFVSSDNDGASQAVAAYLRRTSTAFNELVQFHKDHKDGNLKMIKKTRRVDPVKLCKEESLVKIGEKGIFELKKKSEVSLGNGENVEGIGGDWNGEEEERRKKMKKGEGREMDCEGNLGIKKNIEGSGNEVNVNVKDGGRKKEERMKKREDVVREKEDNLGVKAEGKKKKKKKRKTEVVDEREISNSTEQSGRKKKRRRVEGED